jgi:hypothetical protein
MAVEEGVLLRHHCSHGRWGRYHWFSNIQKPRLSILQIRTVYVLRGCESYYLFDFDYDVVSLETEQEASSGKGY